ncbi:MAG: hypothetical protein ACRD0P_19560 [Stackebrandtia sp.]
MKTTTSHVLESLFVSEATWQAPSIAERYQYKKVKGHADTGHTSDEFE